MQWAATKVRIRFIDFESVRKERMSGQLPEKQNVRWRIPHLRVQNNKKLNTAIILIMQRKISNITLRKRKKSYIDSYEIVMK